MNILQVINSVDPATGGPIEGIVRQQAVLPPGFNTEIASLDLPDAPYLDGFPVKVHALGRHGYNRWIPWRRYGWTPYLVPWLRQNASKFDCVIVHGLWNYSCFAASRVLPGGGTPYFVYSHGMLDPWFRRRYPLKHLAKQISWLICEGRLVNGADAVLFTAEEERRLARGQFWPYRPRERVVGFGTADVTGIAENQRAAFTSAFPDLAGRDFFLFLSRIHPKKGCDILVEAFATIADRWRNIDLVMAGPDQLGWTAELRARARALGVEQRIHWTGMLTGDMKWGAFRSAAAFVLPSHSENFGVVVAEALACGVPVLITERVNIWREIVEGGGGTASDDATGPFSGIMERFLGMNSDERAAMQSNARRVFLTIFESRRSAAAFVQVLSEVDHGSAHPQAAANNVPRSRRIESTPPSHRALDPARFKDR